MVDLKKQPTVPDVISEKSPQFAEEDENVLLSDEEHMDALQYSSTDEEYEPRTTRTNSFTSSLQQIPEENGMPFCIIFMAVQS